MSEVTFCTDCALLINNDEATEDHRATFRTHWGTHTHTATASTEPYAEFGDTMCDGCGTDAAGARYHGTDLTVVPLD